MVDLGATRVFDRETDDLSRHCPDGELILGRYVPEREAGTGGFSRVVVAWDTRIHRRVAIKCIPLDEATASFGIARQSILVDEGGPDTSHIPGLDEARTAALLSDASIVQIYDFEVQGSTAYLILEYVDGMTLADLLDFHPDEIDADIAAALFKSIARALQVAHAKHVLHLDIKPENVLIDTKGQVKVTDFGLARLADEAGYGAAAGGTIGYMPPEQMRREELDERCDQWALASLMYEVISGANPFFADSLSAAQDAIYDSEIVIPSLCMDGLDEGIDDVVFRALDPDREGRYASVEEFAQTLQPCLGSSRRGADKLKALVGQEDIAEEDEGVSRGDAPSRRVASVAWRSIGLRSCSALFAAFAAYISVGEVVGPAAWDGVEWWAAAIGFVVLGAIFPRVVSLVGVEALGVAFCAAGAPIPGVLLGAMGALWWWFAGRESVESSVVASIPLVFGAMGMTPALPFVAGFMLPWRTALATTLFAGVFAFVLAGMGSSSLAGWYLWEYSPGAISPALSESLFALIQLPSTWIVVASWAVASLVASLLCASGSRLASSIGMIIVAGVCFAGLVAASVLDSGGTVLLSRPVDLVPLIVSFSCAIAAASTMTPARCGEGSERAR